MKWLTEWAAISHNVANRQPKMSCLASIGSKTLLFLLEKCENLLQCKRKHRVTVYLKSLHFEFYRNVN